MSHYTAKARICSTKLFFSYVERPRHLETIIHSYVEAPRHIETVVPVEKHIETVVPVEKVVEKLVTKEVPVYIDRCVKEDVLVEVEKVDPRTRIAIRCLQAS